MNTQTASRRPGVLGRIGAGITHMRNFVLNTLFLVLLVLVLAAALSNCSSVHVTNNSALVIRPVGTIVEQRSFSDPLQNLFTLGSQIPEVELGELVAAIDHAATDEQIRMIVLNLDELVYAAPAHTQRIGQALNSFRARDKRVVAYGHFFEQSQYHIASFADALYMHPMGQVMLQGFGGTGFYFADLLERFEVNVNVFRVGTYKAAVEPFTRNDMSAESRKASEELNQNLWERTLGQMAENRHTTKEALQHYADHLPEALQITGGDLARAALENHLVDELLTPDQVEVRIANDVGYQHDDSGEINGIDFESYLQARGLHASGQQARGEQIAVIVASGMIVDAVSGPGMLAADDIVPLIRQAREDASIRAVVLRVDSPGGSQFASELIRQELELVQLSGKPVVASFGAVAASGGYWISSTADAIVAEPASITGSIGIFSFVPTFEDTLARYGVHTDGTGTTAITQGMGVFSGLNEPVKQILQARVEHGYEQFLSLVARGRNMQLQAVDEVAQGRVWSGEVARELGLVDTLGGLDTALEKAAELAGLEQWSRVHLRQPVDPRSLLLRQLLSPQANIAATPVSRFSAQLSRMAGMLNAFDDPGATYALCMWCGPSGQLP